MKPCTHPNDLSVAGCPGCVLYDTHPGYRALWGVGSSDRPPTRIARQGGTPLPVLTPCAHRGEIVIPCHSCRNENGTRDVRDCAVHGQCTGIECGKDVGMVCAACVRDNLGYQPCESKS